MGQGCPQSGPHREACPRSRRVSRPEIASHDHELPLLQLSTPANTTENVPRCPTREPRPTSSQRDLSQSIVTHRTMAPSSRPLAFTTSASYHYFNQHQTRAILRELSICLPFERQWWYPRAPLPRASSLLEHLPAPLCPEGSAHGCTTAPSGMMEPVFIGDVEAVVEGR